MHPLAPVPILSTILHHILSSDTIVMGPSATLVGQFPHPLPTNATSPSAPPTPHCSLVCGAVLQPSAPGVGPHPICITTGVPPLPRPGMQTLRVPCQASIFLPRIRVFKTPDICSPNCLVLHTYLPCSYLFPDSGNLPQIYPSAQDAHKLVCKAPPEPASHKKWLGECQ